MSAILAVCGTAFCAMVSDGRYVEEPITGEKPHILKNDLPKVRKINRNVVVGFAGDTLAAVQIINAVDEYQTQYLTLEKVVKILREKAATVSVQPVGVRLIVGNARRREVVPLLERARREGRALCAVEDLTSAPFEPLDVLANEGHTRAVMKIQEGCDNRCAYCIIPEVRGPIRSRSLSDVAAEARALGRAGYREVVLTGIHLASYGRDFRDGTTLLDAIEAVCAAQGVERVRLGSLEPAWIDGPYAQRMARSEKLCPQFHLSLQSGCDRVLGAMRRRYTTAQFRRAVQSLRESFPGCAVTTDLIVGFPGETEEEFSESLAFLKTCGLSMFHIFPYSRRKGTPAADMPGQIPNAVKERRAAEAASAAAELEAAYHASMLGTTQQVLFEQEENGLYAGHAMNYVKVYVQAAQLHNELRAVRVTDLCRDGVFGELE